MAREQNGTRNTITFDVMAGLVPAIPIREALCLSDRDHRHKAGDDVEVEANGRVQPVTAGSSSGRR